jgi:hypothetical protein
MADGFNFDLLLQTVGGMRAAAEIRQAMMNT